MGEQGKTAKEVITMKDWEDISDMLTPEGSAAITKGQVLVFRQADGSQRAFKVMRKTKRHCWVAETRLYTSQEAQEMLNVHED